MAHETIDLVSDSEDDISASQTAATTLKAFGVRKEKEISQKKRNVGTPPTITQKPHAQQQASGADKRNASPYTATNYQNLPPNASLADILRYGSTNASTLKSAPPAKAKQRSNPKPSPKTERRFGPLHEERLRRFQEFHNKEAERRGDKATESMVGLGANTPTKVSGTPLSSSLNLPRSGGEIRSTTAGAPVPPKRRPSSPAGGLAGPGRKRRKGDAQGKAEINDLPGTKQREEDGQDKPEIEDGMQAARRLSLAAMSPALGNGTSQPVSTRESVGSSAKVGHAEPKEEPTLQETAPSVESNHGLTVPKAATLEGTFSQPISISDSREPSPNVIPAKPTRGPELSKVGQTKLTQSHADQERDSSPDEIPAKPLVKTVKEDLPRSMQSSPDEVPATASSGIIESDLPGARESSPDEIPATAPSKIIGGDLPRPTQSSLGEVPATTPGKVIKPISGKKSGRGGNHGKSYTEEEDARLISLRDEHKVSWEVMPSYFSGRTQGSLAVHYYTTLKSKGRTLAKPKARKSHGLLPNQTTEASQHASYVATTDRPESSLSTRRVRTAPKNDGMVSWAAIKKARQAEHSASDIRRARQPHQNVRVSETDTPMTDAPSLVQSPPSSGLDLAYPASLDRILRSRELGSSGGRSWSSKARMKVSDELQNHVFDTLGPRRYFHGTPRDVTTLAWACDGNRFAAGAIAMDDEASMQYNGPNNLLLGDVEKNSLIELPEHHVPRPIITSSHNVNSLHAMRETQDPRLFKTVTAVEFSDDGNLLFSAGGDGVVRMYDTNMGVCLSSHKHRAEVSLLAKNPNGVLASACNLTDDGSISILRCDEERLSSVCEFGPSRADVQSSLPISPSALKWGSGTFSNFLLAGFMSESSDDDRLTAGEILLWDSTNGQKIDLPTVRNVFDVAWNPSPSSGSSLFAVAGARAGKRLRSTIECFAPNQGRASRVLQWDCPALDINDLIYCPHDDNIIAAGATDGKVYIWDKRFANRNQLPLHTLSHSRTKNVLDHNLNREVADSGVRFLSWSATGNRLYSGSSDGTVKIWNPYRTSQDALVKDVATFNSAIISGAFSPDHRDLLIGEEQGQLNLLGIDREARSIRAAKKFDLYPAPVPKKAGSDDKFAPARELLDNGEIEIKPMGVLPRKQAVQGPNYHGPLMKPSAEGFARLYDERQSAMLKQAEVSSTMLDHDDPQTEKAIKNAEANIRQIEEVFKKAERNSREYQILEPLATEHQRKLREARHAYKKDALVIAMKRCKLDCNYLPTAGDDDGEAPDSQHSHQRIPASLRFQHPTLDASDLTNAEIQEAGLTSKCCSCLGPAAKPKRGRLPKCEKCTLTHAGLTARCEKCFVPIRPNLEGQLASKNFCQRCEFRCLRCGQLASVSPRADFVECEPCSAVWEAGILGYELKSFVKSKGGSDEKCEPVMESLDQRTGRLFGDEERERLAGGWRVALVDGFVGK